METSPTARRALRRLARGLVASAAVAVLASQPAYAAALAQVDLPTGLRPEGITSGQGYTYYVGSLADGRIVTGDLRTGSSAVLLAGAAGRQLRGLCYDERSGLVWAAGNVGAEAHVWAVDGRSGAVVQDTVVPGAAFLNDLVVTRDAVWVTDSRVDRLTRLALGPAGMPLGSAPSFLPLSGAWPANPGTGINANGIRDLDDGSLLLNNSRVGGLWQVDPQTGVVTVIPVTGGVITGGDGLERVGPIVYNVRGSGAAVVSVVRLHRSPAGWSATWQDALTDPGLAVPTTATVVGSTVFAVNARFGVPNPAAADYWITPLGR